MSTRGYAGDVTPNEAWRELAGRADAQLVDVRTRPEWGFVGLPDLSAVGKEPLLQAWQVYPEMQVAPAFVDEVSRALDSAGATRESPVFFLCRSGARSAAAAAAMTAAGWANCFNVAGGFEGRLDPARHRGGLEGWKAEGLPWIQS